MIVMINGAFGVGKTTVAHKLLEAIENSMLFDPEEVGFMLRNIISEDIMHPVEETGDFQDFDIWKELTVKTAESLKNQYGKNLIVPMTIYNQENFQYIVEGFKQMDEQTYHFCLMAKEETIYERLRHRGEAEGNWCFQQTKKCLEAYRDHSFKEFIATDDINVSDVTNEITNYIASYQNTALR